MKLIKELNLGFNDAENYKKRENKELFNTIFVKNHYLDKLLIPSTYFLIGEKGTGKTAYAVYLSINNYKNTLAELKYMRETDYQKFITLKQKNHLDLSDYTNIWSVIILLLISKSIKPDELMFNPISKRRKIKLLLDSIDEYYTNAFAPEIPNALSFVEEAKIAVGFIAKNLKLGGELSQSIQSNESKFQVNLLYLQKHFEEALSKLKLKENLILFIDGIDIRPDKIAYNDYLDCIKGLATAIWNLNNDFFSSIKDSKGRLRCVLLLRPDILHSLKLQNLNNKIRDNSVYLDWRTTYKNYKHSDIFTLSDKLLSSQQNGNMEIGKAWNHYLPWTTKSTETTDRNYDDSFINCLRISFSRPRDIVTILKILLYLDSLFLIF